MQKTILENWEWILFILLLPIPVQYPAHSKCSENECYIDFEPQNI